MATKKRVGLSDKQAKSRKSAAHARVVAQLRAAEREIKVGERIMRASRATLKAAGRTVSAVQRIDTLAAKVIVHGVKGQSRAKSVAARKGWDK